MEPKSFGIAYVRGSGLGLEVYADADYADKSSDSRSVSGTAITLGGTAVSHANKTQHVVSLSTSEAEYTAAADGSRKLCLHGSFCLSLRPRRVGQALRPLRTTRGRRR